MMRGQGAVETEPGVEPEQPGGAADFLVPLVEMREDLFRVLEDRRWGYALMTVGWIHLLVFLVCQPLYVPDGSRTLVFLGLWLAELFAILIAMRFWLGKNWKNRCTIVNLTFKIWVTFLILSFNVASMNTLMGWQSDWFKAVWATLSTFVMMMLTFLISPWFFAGAVWMYFTGLAMVKLPDWNYVIYGLSWWAAFQAGGVAILRRAWTLRGGSSG